MYNITKILNIASFFLVAISLFNIGMNQFKTGATGQYKLNEEYVKVSQAGSRLQREYPNIYYIVLDAYARADVLEDIYKYDNTEFINYLTQKGFYVAGKSRSNYCQTALSLASSLNYTYLNDLAESVDIDNASHHPLTKMIRDNRVFHFLKQYGYRTVIFDASGWDVVAMKNADIIYNTPRWGLNAFHRELVNTTPLFYVFGRTSVLSTIMQYNYHRSKILYTFDKLREVGNQEGPLFVYAHILVPHQPFVFGANGEQVVPDTDPFSIWYTVQMGRKREAYVEEYTKQLAFVNKMVKEAIDSIISKSSVPPVIILQADHGPASMLNTEDSDKTNIKERMSILNAYYFPGNDYEHLYESITPVNTFRIIFNQFFETQYELLKDESFFSTWSQPYRFIDVAGKFHTER